MSASFLAAVASRARKHSPLCDCGCVPDFPSLFEQARIRAARKAAKLAAESAAKPPTGELAQECESEDDDP